MDERLSIDPEACLSASRNTFNLSSLLFVSRFGIPLRHLSFSLLLSLFRLRFQIPLHLLHPQLSPKMLVNLSDLTPGRLHEVICLCMAGLRCLRGCYLHAGHLPVLRHLLRRPGLSSYPTDDEGQISKKKEEWRREHKRGSAPGLGLERQRSPSQTCLSPAHALSKFSCPPGSSLTDYNKIHL